MKKVVIGGTYKQLVSWALAQQPKLGPRDVAWIGSDRDMERLMGLELSLDDIVRLGPVSSAVEELLATRIRLPSRGDVEVKR